MSTSTPLESREKKPSFIKGTIFLLVLVVIIALLTLAALTRRSADGPLVATQAPAALSVMVARVEMSEGLDLEESFSGLVVARRTSQLGFSGSGRIANIRVDIGQLVQQGQILAKLDTRNLEANLAAARATIAEAEANYALAVATVSRQRTLFEKGHVAQQRVDEAEAQASAAAARIQAANAQADTIQVSIDLSAIRAPFTGVITDRMVDEGAIAVPGMAMLELVESLKLEARIGLPSPAANLLEEGKTYTLISDRGPVEAVLRARTGIIDQTLRTVMTVFDITQPETVDTGAVVRLALPRTLEERGFWAPISALSESSRGLWALYIVQADSQMYRAEPRLVEIVHTDGERAYVRGTVKDGERYIIEGISRLVPGQAVAPVLSPVLAGSTASSAER